jgi:hypothetical protein
MNKSEAYKQTIKLLSVRKDILSKTILNNISIIDFDSYDDNNNFTNDDINNVILSLSCKFE